ncbi:hypothetical protein CDL15_Pgr008681 [Punica granatum]|uniref:Uncharacterized protein n=1 Tax=Punica granatum TaxID=22663 RepID=A0A218WEB2_PUNGR|nr:hypothetical protein CDL15_Pgr008681 [Punica granatum]
MWTWSPWTHSPKGVNVDAESKSSKCGRGVRKAINVDAESKSSKCGRGVQKAINVDAESVDAEAKSSKCGRGARKAINVDAKSMDAESKSINVDAEYKSSKCGREVRDAESKSSKCERGVRKAINVDEKYVDAESKSSKCGRGVRKAINVNAESESNLCSCRDEVLRRCSAPEVLVCLICRKPALLLGRLLVALPDVSSVAVAIVVRWRCPGRAMKDSSSVVERLRIPRGRKSESAVVPVFVIPVILTSLRLRCEASGLLLALHGHIETFSKVPKRLYRLFDAPVNLGPFSSGCRKAAAFVTRMGNFIQFSLDFGLVISGVL